MGRDAERIIEEAEQAGAEMSPRNYWDFMIEIRDYCGIAAEAIKETCPDDFGD